VRSDHWQARTFYASPCKFFIDVPLDMSGCIVGAVHEASRLGLSPRPGGQLLVTDTLFRGAVLVEVAPPVQAHPQVVTIGGDVLARDLPQKGAKLRGELDELVRWALEIGQEVTGCYVRYEPAGNLPGLVRPAEVFAAVRGEADLV